ncbi:hypothetical protein MKW94_010263 [Papaver nudicaule]|uniref:Histone deacetylase interacting domain-containing protein n=1 Tax=Papaver nudicaule TaxID=74823 RepID=A0AA41RQF6_PAPNU|nr:hypothetical protein [Papaver nudicaule]
MKRIRENDCYEYIKAVQKAEKYNEFLQVMKEYKSFPTHTATALDFVTTRIKQVFNGHSDLIRRFNELFLPEEYAIEEEDGAAGQNRVMKLKSTQRVQAADHHSGTRNLHSGKVSLHKDYKFIEHIRKEKFRDPDLYKKFLKCLYLYSKEIISRDDLGNIVGDLLQYGTVFTSTTANKDTVHEEEPEKDEKGKSDDEVTASKRRKIEEPSMIDGMECEEENPSYQLSTDKTSASGRTELGVIVLNDSWVSIGKTPTYQLKRNIYQQNLFRCEDDRCERDRQKELVTATTKLMEELLQKVEDKTISEENLRLEDHFKALYLGCIKRLYAESWQSVVDELSKNAVAVLRGVLARLQDKLQEVTGCLSGKYRKKMRAVYAKNFKKSLNHGKSSCELQQDTTSSSDKDDDASTSCPNILAKATDGASTSCPNLLAKATDDASTSCPNLLAKATDDASTSCPDLLAEATE